MPFFQAFHCSFGCTWDWHSLHSCWSCGNRGFIIGVPALTSSKDNRSFLHSEIVTNLSGSIKLFVFPLLTLGRPTSEDPKSQMPSRILNTYKWVCLEKCNWGVFRLLNISESLFLSGLNKMTYVWEYLESVYVVHIFWGRIKNYAVGA